MQTLERQLKYSRSIQAQVQALVQQVHAQESEAQAKLVETALNGGLCPADAVEH